jgi:5'-deoxynucleotidase YfbR-like HD superfamily hydrolase
MKTNAAITIPSDIKPLVDQLETVRRFVSPAYPSGIFNDTVYQHVFRCVQLAEYIVPSINASHFPINLDLVKRILWIHDLVEIGLSSDVPAPDKSTNLDLRASVAAAEEQNAKKLLSPGDYHLWHEFETAKAVLQFGVTKEVIVEAVVSKIIDLVDGNVVFNQAVSNYITRHHINIEIPPESLTYAFNTHQQYYNFIAQHEDWQPLLALLQFEQDFIKHLWHDIPPDLIPPALHPHLNN